MWMDYSNHLKSTGHSSGHFLTLMRLDHLLITEWSSFLLRNQWWSIQYLTIRYDIFLLLGSAWHIHIDSTENSDESHLPTNMNNHYVLPSDSHTYARLVCQPLKRLHMLLNGVWGILHWLTPAVIHIPGDNVNCWISRRLPRAMQQKWIDTKSTTRERMRAINIPKSWWPRDWASRASLVLGSRQSCRWEWPTRNQ